MTGGAGIALLAALTCFACQRNPPDPIRDYARLAVALGERDPHAIDYYYGPAEWVADVREHPPTIGDIRKLARYALDNQPPDETTASLRAIEARAAILAGTNLSFDEEASALFGITAPPTDRARVESARMQLNRLLPGPGTLTKRYEAFEREYAIPQDRTRRVMDEALRACRKATMGNLPLPPNDSVKAEIVHDKPWSGYSYYQGNFKSLVQFNADAPLTVDQALELACHETYPGHHAQSSLVESQLTSHGLHRELLVQPTFSPQSFLAEALATQAASLAFPPLEREKIERENLYPPAGIDPTKATKYFQISKLASEIEFITLDIAREYLDHRLEFLRAEDRMQSEALISNPEATLKYLNEYRTYMLGYTLGKRMAQECFARVANDSPDRWRLLERLVLRQTTLEKCALH